MTAATTNDYPLVWVVMGVAGSGKTTVGRLLAERLECDFLEGDRRHSPGNIAKMARRQPLDERDRDAWLADLHADIARAVSTKRDAVVSCSGLRADHRARLASPGRVRLVLLDVPRDELAARLTGRRDHYMAPEMLDSQLNAFEPPGAREDVLVVDGNLPTQAVVDQILTDASERWPQLRQAWWRRLLASS